VTKVDFMKRMLAVWNKALPKDKNLTIKDVETMVSGLFMAVKDVVDKDGDLKIGPLCNFELKKRAARTGRNPRTGEEIQIAASKKISFKPLKDLKF